MSKILVGSAPDHWGVWRGPATGAVPEDREYTDGEFVDLASTPGT